MTQLVDQRAADEARSSRDQDSHGRRVYWRACALLTAAPLLAAGCHGSKHRTPEPQPKLSFLALDRVQQRLVSDYEPVSRALTAYERAFREAQAGRLSRARLLAEARGFRAVVNGSLGRLRHDGARGETAAAKAFLVHALVSRRRALDLLLADDLSGYLQPWNRSLVYARRALTKLQDIRDRARLIPLPEDSIS